MTKLERLERALALAKELKFTDLQVEELVSLVLGLPITRINLSPAQPIIPWTIPSTPTWPPPNGDSPFTWPTIICQGITSVGTTSSGIVHYN